MASGFRLPAQIAGFVYKSEVGVSHYDQLKMCCSNMAVVVMNIGHLSHFGTSQKTFESNGFLGRLSNVSSQYYDAISIRIIKICISGNMTFDRYDI